MIDPEVKHGEPVIKGTRVPVDVILGSLASEMSIEEVCEEYGVEREDVLAALSYAQHVVSSEEVHPLESR